MESQTTSSQVHGDIPLHGSGAGTGIGRYEIIYPISTGGMATVYVGRLAGFAGFERLVAIKLVHKHLSAKRQFVDMFLDEARLAASIHHANVAETFEVGEEGGRYYLVSELVLGSDLQELFVRAAERHIWLEPSLCADIVLKVCRGLHEAHELVSVEGESVGLVHRDVSPKNILLSFRGEVKLIDFGVAWAKDRLVKTDAGLIKGKVGYLAPEQIRGEPADRRSDVFSLGVVLYSLATQTHPFPGDSQAERFHRILGGKFLPPSEISADVSPEMEQIIDRALSPLREQRYQSAAEMAHDLERFLLSRGVFDQTPVLSILMNDFFASELSRHRQQLRQYHAASADTGLELFGTPAFRLPASSAAQRGIGNMTPLHPPPGGVARAEINEDKSWPKIMGRVLLLVILTCAGLVAGALWGQQQGTASLAPGSFYCQRALSRAAALSFQAPSAPTTLRNAPLSKTTVRIDLLVFEKAAKMALDGQPISPDTTNLAVPADGADHALEITWPGRPTRKFTFVANGDQVIRATPGFAQQNKAKKPRSRAKRDSHVENQSSPLLNFPQN